jgi:Zn-finger nucleic acid-binding protein
MNCPKDNSQLDRLSVRANPHADIHLDVCKKCQGVWVDHNEIAPLISHFSTDVQMTYKNWLVAVSDGKTEPNEFWSEGERPCPQDGMLMKKHYSGVAQHVGLEQCPTCGGFWFDGSELYAIAHVNEPNPSLDQAITGAIAGLQTELHDNYDNKAVFWWDIYNNPKAALPYITDLLLDFMAAYVARK